MNRTISVAEPASMGGPIVRRQAQLYVPNYWTDLKLNIGAWPQEMLKLF
jgi:hypothetical protein